MGDVHGVENCGEEGRLEKRAKLLSFRGEEDLQLSLRPLEDLTLSIHTILKGWPARGDLATKVTPRATTKNTTLPARL